MATAADSVLSREASLASPASRLNLLTGWHLFSLDAPTVAVLWSLLFARSVHVHLPWSSPAILGIGTWLIYVADRLLDGYRPFPGQQLQERHRFHARHRAAFLTVAATTSVFLVWLIATQMASPARFEDTVLFAAALIYFFLVHKPQGRHTAWLPKELAVGIVFAAATAVPAWSRTMAARASLLPAVTIFAALCWLNCVAIERWENGVGPTAMNSSHPTTRWTANHFRVVIFALGMIAALSAAWTRSSVTLFYIAAFGSALCLGVVDQYRHRMTTMTLRIAADATLLTPLLILPFLT